MPSFGAATTQAGSTSGTGPTVSGSDTIGIVTLHSASSFGTNPSGVTWGGSSMTRLTPDANRTVHVFYIANPSSGATISADGWSPSDQHGMVMAYWTDADTPTNDGDGTCSGAACEVTATTPSSTTSGSALVLATSWRGAGCHNDALGSWEVNGSATGVSEAADVADSGLGDDLRFGMGYDDDGATGSTDSMSATPAGSRDRIHDGTVFEIPAAAASADPLELDHLDASPTFHSPELVGFIDLTHLDASASFHSPTVANASIDLDHLDASPTFHSPELVGFVDLDHLDASPTFHTITVAALAPNAIDLDHLDASPTFHSPTVAAASIDLDHLDASPTFHTITLIGTEIIQLDHLDASPTFHTIIVAAVSIDLDHLDASPTFHTITVFTTVSPSETGKSPAALASDAGGSAPSVGDSRTGGTKSLGGSKGSFNSGRSPSS